MIAGFHLANHFSFLSRYSGHLRYLKSSLTMTILAKELANPMPRFYWSDLLFGLMGAGILVIYLTERRKARNSKHHKGEEFGSAKWGTASDIKPYIDPKPYNNMILTKTESLTLNPRPKDIKCARNKNVAVVGGSGSGKTRFHILPNLMQLSPKTSYIVTDPKGSVLLETGHMLLKHGYRIRIFNTINFKKSHRYNPFRYISSEKDILKLVTVIIANTTPEGTKSNDPFWTSAEKLLLSALIGYIWLEVPKVEQNFTTLLDMINACEVRENDESFKNAIDELMDKLAEDNPKHFAVRQYKRYKLAAGKTAKSILISCGARLAPLDIEELRDVMKVDEIDIDSIGTRKTALFIIISDTDDTFNFIAAMLYSQLFNRLCELADDKYGGSLPYRVRILADEFANTGKIPGFEKLIATIRSRGISVSIILQTLSQLRALYKDADQIITGNCDSFLFLGGKEESTLKSISRTLGKETIDYCNGSETKGNSISTSRSTQHTGRSLMAEDELSVMDGGKCILQIRGIRPFFSDKYDIKSHPRYKELLEYDKKKNAFDPEAYVSCRCQIREDERIDFFYINGEESI